MERFRPGLMISHAWREARREKIPIQMIKLAYDDPDEVFPSDHDELREIRSRWFGTQGVEVVVDVDSDRVITVWRRGDRP